MLMKTVVGKMTKRFDHPERRFNAASWDEPLVFGARRPGYPLPRVPDILVESWIAFMKTQNITRVLCLLSAHQLHIYDNLLEQYATQFGEQQVLWVPIRDFHLATEEQLLGYILPFLMHAPQRQEKTVVHCSGGVGRTGHVLAAWLVSARHMTNSQAIASVKYQGRNAREAHDKRLDLLLERCRQEYVSRS